MTQIKEPSVHAFILAAGKGARMLSATPKPLTQVAGVLLVDRVILAVEGAFPQAWSIVLGHKAALVRLHLDKHVTSVHQRVQRGAGHALKVALKSLPAKLPEYIVVVPVDHPLLEASTLREFLAKAKESGAKVAVATTIAPGEFAPTNPFWNAGRIIRDAGGVIRRIVELKDADRDERAVSEVNAGCYVFLTVWLRAHINKMKPGSVAKEYHLTDLVRLATLEGARVVAYPVANWRECIGISSPEEVRFAENIILGKSMGT